MKEERTLILMSVCLDSPHNLDITNTSISNHPPPQISKDLTPDVPLYPISAPLHENQIMSQTSESHPIDLQTCHISQRRFISTQKLRLQILCRRWKRCLCLWCKELHVWGLGMWSKGLSFSQDLKIFVNEVW